MAKWELNGVKFANDAEAEEGCKLYDMLVEKFGKEKANERWPKIWDTVKDADKKIAAMCKKYNVTYTVIEPKEERHA